LRKNAKLKKYFTQKLMATLTKLRKMLRKAQAIEAKAETPQKRYVARSIVGRLKRAAQSARKKYYKETFGY
jgi:hypothetical protein